MIVTNDRVLSKEEEDAIKLFTDNGYIVSIERESVPLTAKKAFQMWLNNDILYRLLDDYKTYQGLPAKDALKDMYEFEEISLGQLQVYDHSPTERLIRNLLTHLINNPNTYSAFAYLNGRLHALRMSENSYYTVDGIALTYDKYADSMNERHLTFDIPPHASILPHNLKKNMEGIVNPWSVNTGEYSVVVTGGFLIHPVEDWDMEDTENLDSDDAKALLTQAIAKKYSGTTILEEVETPSKGLDESLSPLDKQFRDYLDKFCVTFKIGTLIYEAKMSSDGNDIYIRTPNGSTTTVAKADPNTRYLVYAKGQPMEPKE
ncbi:hypothetical protein EalM132_00031 [Exiguobacterium phage vB_EalM-132]|nr:hypothetical protein EalM132_00031 [Exiguobacterium phage vB_EalM-132]